MPITTMSVGYFFRIAVYRSLSASGSVAEQSIRFTDLNGTRPKICTMRKFPKPCGAFLSSPMYSSMWHALIRFHGMSVNSVSDLRTSF